MKALKALTLAVGLCWGVGAFAQSCDELASSPYDITKPAHIAGVKVKDINLPLAIGVCTEELAKQPNHARLQYNLARAYYQAKQYDKAVELLTQSANQGHAGGQLGLGVVYEKGHGVPQDYVKAFEWFTKSANQGHAGGQLVLGLMYHDGRGVAQDYAKAFEWYSKSANQGLAEAQHNLGAMYHDGKGIPKNPQTAKLWFNKACDNGYKDACQFR